MKFEAMTDKAMAQELGQRVEQMRLEQNFTQQQLADEMGISRRSYQGLISGSGTFINVIAVLRALNRIDLVQNFIPETIFSPMAQLEMEGKKRQRARPNKVIGKGDGSDELDW